MGRLLYVREKRDDKLVGCIIRKVWGRTKCHECGSNVTPGKKRGGGEKEIGEIMLGSGELGELGREERRGFELAQQEEGS